MLLVAVLHFMTDDFEVRDILKFLKQKLAPGSYLAISHPTLDLMRRDSRAFTESYRQQVSDIRLRTREEIAALLDGFELVDPKLVFISDWKPELPDMLDHAYIPLENSSFACVVKSND